MRFLADFHLHSPFSRATSSRMSLESLDGWARIKGLALVGTGDVSHPGWTTELGKKLAPAEEGFFRLRHKSAASSAFPFRYRTAVRFVLCGEVSNVYRYNGRVRKIHSLLFFPGLASVRRFQNKLEELGKNIRSDGRPILGMDVRDLLEMCLDISPGIRLVPAHIWTPWFSVLGARSGFDSIRDCFRDLSGHIHALETGLSSDPPMNRRCSILDRYTLISNSDAHSPEKLGREANIFNCEFSYPGIMQALRHPGDRGLAGTLEFFPQEGKYHYNGHRKCGIRLSPREALELNMICPRCQKPLTMGVAHRVHQLADRSSPRRAEEPDCHSLIGLTEILSEIHRTGPGSQKVHRCYREVLGKLETTELDLLLTHPLEEIMESFPLLAEAVDRMRRRQVIISEGYDGRYGTVRLFQPGEL